MSTKPDINVDDIVIIEKDRRNFLPGFYETHNVVGRRGRVVGASAKFVHVRAIHDDGSHMGSGTPGFFFCKFAKTSVKKV